MPNAKRITCDWNETGKTIYTILRREADNYRLNDADGTFAAAPADPYLSLAEDPVIKGRYEVNESRTVWNDGLYTAPIFKQAGGSPTPANDTIIGSWEAVIKDDAIVYIDVLPSTRLAAASYTAPDNAGIDFIEKWILNKLVTVDNGNGTKTIKLYDDAGTEPPLKTWTYTVATDTRSKAT